MECISCNEAKPPHRVVIDAVDETLLGGYCRGCEEESFGRSLRRRAWHPADRCLLCERDGFYTLPLLRIETDAGAESPESSVTVSIAGRANTVELCDRHLNATVAPDETCPTRAVESSRSHT